jgi:peptidoglycan/LPS O-acetylase OafA/YrhL
MGPALAVACMVFLTILFVTEASRRGTARMLGATAVSVSWLAVTAATVRSANEIEAGYAVRNYAIVMGIALLAYFRSKGRRPDRPSGPAL